MRSAEQVLDGLIKYVDNEVMSKLPTSGKWVMGTAIALASSRAKNIVDALSNNTIVKTLGVVDEYGDINVEVLMPAVKQAADKYGNISFEVPFIGKMTFSSLDIDILMSYIS